MKAQSTQLTLLSTIAYGIWCAIATFGQIEPSRQIRRGQFQQVTARVMRVASGQQIEVELNGKRETVRLLGIDAPDLRQEPWGLASQQALAREIEGREVALSWAGGAAMPKRDRFDHLHAWVWIDDRLAADELVRSGWALSQADGESTYSSDLAASRAEARVLERGMWDPESALRQNPRDIRSER